MNPARLGGLVLLLAGSGAALHRGATAPEGSAFELEATSSRPRSGPLPRSGPETLFASSGATPSVHSPSAVELPDGRILAVWYGGSREGARDVAIFGASFDPRTASWTNERVIVTREETARALRRGIRKLGNPVLARDATGKLWLFYVSVSVGGWSGSAVNVMVSDDGGETWGLPRRLVTSPFLNVATLVKGPAFGFADGSTGLPVYHEFLGKFSEVLRLDAAGVVLGKQRLSWGRSTVQPVVVPLTASRALAFMRKSGHAPPRIHLSETTDGGASWTSPRPLALANPDAAVFALRASSGELLLAFNDSEVDRSRLSLAVSHDDADSWNVVHVFQPPAPLPETRAPRFAYPWMVESGREPGRFHLLYTWDRTHIVHVRFADALWREAG